MISRIEVKGFKSLRHIDLALGALNLFVGTNASGKSNFFDALRVLQGIGYGFTVDEIFNGKPKSSNSEVWLPLRGGSAKADFMEPEGTISSLSMSPISLSVTLSSGNGAPDIIYTIGLSPNSGCVRSESLSSGSTIFDSSPVSNPADSPFFEVRYYPGKQGRQPHLRFEKSRPVLHQMLSHGQCQKQHKEVIQRCIRSISNIQRIDPTPAILREYAQAQSVKRMGERGENFAALVNTIAADERSKSAYVSWLKQLTPTDIDDIAVLRGALNEPLFAIRERGIDQPAPILSDGTLRFAAIAAVFFQPDMPDILTIEEIENGIHPSRLRLLIELLRSQSSTTLQIMATTHSPIALAWLKESDYLTTFFCKRDDSTGESSIRPLSMVPGFQNIVRKQPIGDLFAEGWLEGAL